MTAGSPTTERYSPQERRAKLRAFADRMLDHLEDLPPPQDRAELERTVRTGLLIERLYARVDIAERRAPPPPLTPEQEAAEAAEAEQRRAENHAHWVALVARLRREREAEEAKAAARVAQPAPKSAPVAPAPKPACPPALKSSLNALRQHDHFKDVVVDIEDELENGLNPDRGQHLQAEPPLMRYIDPQDPLTAPVQLWRPTERPDYGGG